MAPFVSVALRVCDELHINEKRDTGMVMKFAKLYSPEKMGKILNEAKTIQWWETNPIAAFMLSLKKVNQQEKAGDI